MNSNHSSHEKAPSETIRLKRTGQATPSDLLDDFMEGDTAQDSICRWCGRSIGCGSVKCSGCGLSIQPTSIELERAHRREWMDSAEASSAATSTSDKESFDKLYRGAMIYLEGNTRKSRTGIIGDTPAHHHHAIMLVEKMIQRDPIRREGYELLAQLHEGEGNPTGAAACYREIMLRHPEDEATRKKYGAVMKSKPRRPPDLMRIHGGVCFGLAWMALWTLQGSQWLPFWVLLGSVTVAGILLLLLLSLLQRRGAGRVVVEPRINPVAFEPAPLPERRLTWREEARRAQWLADVIREHTNVEVPVISPWRFLISLALCLLLTAMLGIVAWINHSAMVFLALPAAFALIFYFVEFQPRARVAYVLLQHFREETQSPWGDPDMPFVPQEVDRPVRGEFLIADPDEFPLTWALNPHPYGFHVHDILDSIQQVLNRHWTFHRYYEEAGITRHYSIYFPPGGRVLGLLAGGNFALAIALTSTLLVSGSMQEARYRRGMGSGFEDLWSSWRNLEAGELADAAARGLEAQDRFIAAENEFPERALPPICVAMSFEAQGKSIDAEAAYRRALSKPGITTPIRRIANNEFANFLLRQRRFDEASGAYRMGLESAPYDPDISNNFGELHFLQKDYEAADAAFRRALKSRPDHAFAQTNLGRCSEFMGDRERARLYYERAIQSQPDHFYTEYARNRLEADLDPRDLSPILLEIADGAVENSKQGHES